MKLIQRTLCGAELFRDHPTSSGIDEVTMNSFIVPLGHGLDFRRFVKSSQEVDGVPVFIEECGEHKEGSRRPLLAVDSLIASEPQDVEVGRICSVIDTTQKFYAVFSDDGSVRRFRLNAWLLPECVAHLTIQEPDVAVTANGNLCCVACKDRVKDAPYYAPAITSENDEDSQDAAYELYKDLVATERSPMLLRLTSYLQRHDFAVMAGTQVPVAQSPNSLEN